mgnify:CR=1 FL=1
MNIKKEKQIAVLAAKTVSKTLLKYFEKKNDVKVKANYSLVGQADLEANEIIVSILKKNFPSHSMITEEAAPSMKKSDFTWHIDPLDGTHNFLYGLPFWGTSIALAYKNEAVLGVIYLPIFDMMITAEKGKGAYINGKRISTENKRAFKKMLLFFEFTYKGRGKKVNFLKQFIGQRVDLRNFGCAVYHLMLVAVGKADGYMIFYTNSWDIAAGFLIVEEAGGKVTDFKGKKWSLEGRQFVASNGKVHNELLRYTTGYK